MIAIPIKKRTGIILGSITTAILILFYLFLSYKQHQINPSDTTIPNATQLFEGLKKIFTPDHTGHTWIYMDICATFKRLTIGLLTGIIFSFVVGIAMGCLPPLHAALYPFISFIARIPPTASLALYFVLFGMDIKLFIAIISIGMSPPLIISIATSVQKDVTLDSIFKAYTLGASHFEVVTNVIIPQILPRILQAIQLAVGPVMVYVIAAEFLLADVGFGYRLKMQSRLLNMNVVYIYLVILGVIGWLIDFSLTYLRRYLCKWFGE